METDAEEHVADEGDLTEHPHVAGTRLIFGLAIAPDEMGVESEIEHIEKEEAPEVGVSQDEGEPNPDEVGDISAEIIGDAREGDGEDDENRGEGHTADMIAREKRGLKVHSPLSAPSSSSRFSFLRKW